MLVNSVTYTFPAEKADAVAAMLRELRDASRRESGCVAFDVSRADAESGVFLLHEVWADRAALDAHYATEHFSRLGVNGVRPLAISRVAFLSTPLS